MINKLRINNEVSWNLMVQNWTVFINLYRSLYRYRMRVPIYLLPLAYLVTAAPYYPNHILPRCNSDKGCLRWRKARSYLGISGICLWNQRDRKATAKPHTFRQIFFFFLIRPWRDAIRINPVTGEWWWDTCTRGSKRGLPKMAESLQYNTIWWHQSSHWGMVVGYCTRGSKLFMTSLES